MAENNTVEQENSTIVHVELGTRVTYNGVEYDALDFDFEKLTGTDANNIEAELQALGKAVLVPALSGDYLMRMAVKACVQPIGADAFETMSLKAYNKIRTAARNFLLNSD